jgi:hypothetical protein
MEQKAGELGPYFTEFEGEARKIAEMAGQAAQHYADGDLQWACNLVNLMHYNLSSFQVSRDGLLREFDEMGLEPRLDDPAKDA